MPITRSAKKALRVSSRKKAFNDSKKKGMKDAIKKAEKSIKAKGKDMNALISSAFSAIDKAHKGGVIAKNTASRRKARLAKMAK